MAQIIDGNPEIFVELIDESPVIDVEVVGSGPAGPRGLQGERGEKGDTGVYIGEEEPEDPDVNVWITPAGGTAVKATVDELNVFIDSAFRREKSFINDISSEVTKKVNPTATGVKVIKYYDYIPAVPGDSFFVSMKIKSLHPEAFAYEIRARKITADGPTGTYYYLHETPPSTASEDLVEGTLSGFSSGTIALEFYACFYYVGSASAQYSETWTIEHFSVSTFAHMSSSIWERGYYNDSGKPAGSADNDTIRTKRDYFIQVCKGSTISNLGSNVRLRYCIYSQPFEEYFVARKDVAANASMTIADDCYIRVYMRYTDSTEFDLDEWIASLPALWGGEIVRYSDMLIYSHADPALDETSENAIQNKVVTQALNAVLPSFALPSNWESKVQPIQEAQGTKFTFAIQTDTHYALDDDIYNGANLKALTNRIGFDFVANLGDVIKGYAGDENTPENMRAAMTEIMMRYVRGISCPLLIAMGNHDTNKQWADAHSGTPFTFDEVWGREFRPSFNTIPEAVYQTGLMYYYKDFNDVRVIVLNTQDGADGGFGIGSTQISWLTNTALNTNKPVLVLSHVPLVDGWSVSSNYVSSYADAVTAIKAYQTGGGTVIGCMSGHTHTQESKTVDGLLYVTFRNSATLCEVVMVDLANKTIDTIPVGFAGAGNRSFSYL